MPTLYRGEPLPRLNDHELSTGRIQSQSATVYNLTDVTRGDVQKYDDDGKMLGVEIASLPGNLTERTVEFTPGFTDRVGTAAFFSHYNMEDPGLVFAFDRSGLPDVEQVEYDLAWFNENPGLFARVDTLSDGELRIEGDLVALTDDGEVWQWGDRMEESVRGTYEDEAEWFTPDTSVSVVDGLQGVASFVGTNTATSGSLDTVLASFDGYMKGWGSTGDTRVDYLDQREKVEAYYEELRAAMNRYGERLVVVLLENQGRIHKTDDSLREKFVLAYDGAEFTESVDDPRLSDWV